MQICHENESEHDIDIEIVGVGLASEDWDFRSFATGTGPNPADPAEVSLHNTGPSYRALPKERTPPTCSIDPPCHRYVEGVLHPGNPARLFAWGLRAEYVFVCVAPTDVNCLAYLSHIRGA